MMPGLAGFTAAAVVGGFTAALWVLVWSLLTTLTTSGVATAPLGWAFLTGLALGTAVAVFRRGKDTPVLAAWGAGATTGLVWAVISGGEPLGQAHLP